jgi:hypothetical protein
MSRSNPSTSRSRDTPVGTCWTIGSISRRTTPGGGRTACALSASPRTPARRMPSRLSPTPHARPAGGARLRSVVRTSRPSPSFIKNDRIFPSSSQTVSVSQIDQCSTMLFTRARVQRSRLVCPCYAGRARLVVRKFVGKFRTISD